VVRDGVAAQIPAAGAVTGDTVLLAEGDRVSADLRLVATLVERTWCAGLARARCPHRVLVRDAPRSTCYPGRLTTSGPACWWSEAWALGATNSALALGSTSLRVLQEARVPVLAVPEERGGATAASGLALRHIIVGVDRSEPSLAAALGVAADIAGVTGAGLSVLEVFEYVPPFPLGPATAVTSRGEQTALETTCALLEAEVRDIRDRGVATQVVVRSGEPAPTLLEVAADVDADLVVVGTKGRGDPAQPLLGNVARTVVNQARRSTLVIPAAAGPLHLLRESETSASGVSCVRLTAMFVPHGPRWLPGTATAWLAPTPAQLRARPVEIEGDREDEAPRPEVHRVELERLVVADDVGDQPDDEPEECHSSSSCC
jgi:nucleotide-binding universal stress UspA family protein